ncbi:MAG: threonylcarbamoyl-AMP synthase [Candidatus Lokiarchaeota archaeon]|nr:threonylcarbamoyl-AMP synthase [Candidatus Lokiarchaeota archaeon]MBD3199343.1 threonylcarbamoyl-AMP synthase [Candidatus Lokiarchaeota archaeon]
MGFLIKIAGKSVDEVELFLDIAVENIIEGKIFAFPTDSVYGLGGDPTNLAVADRLYTLKFRERSKGFLLLVSDIEEAKKIAVFNECANKLAAKFWPGQLTLILEKRAPYQISAEVTGNEKTIGLRVPKNELILRILHKLKEVDRLGVIIGTSANYSGEPPCVSGEEVSRKFLGPIDLIIDSGTTKSQVATTIVDCTQENPKILREGIISEDNIMKVLNE